MRASWFDKLWDSIADRGRDLLRLQGDAGQPSELITLCHRLLDGVGEASGTALTREVQHGIEALDDAGRTIFLELLAAQFQPDRDSILKEAEAYRVDEDQLAAYLRLNAVIESPCQELLRRINRAPHATAMLVRLRAHLLQQLREQPQLKALDADFRHLFLSWFNRGFLQMHRIDWDSPASVLEKLIAYEAVHAIQNWDDLRRRLAADRRCFAFFHPALPGEPLIFVEVALTRGLPSAAPPLLDLDAPVLDPKKADTAIFFSINNCQDGLRGISFGNFLIKQVVNELVGELPAIGRFATLSPIPRFRQVLEGINQEKNPIDRAQVAAVLADQAEKLRAASGEEDVVQALMSLLAGDLVEYKELLEVPLTRLALVYLAWSKRKGLAYDPVSAFHFANGARLERINPFADLSRERLRGSYGVMVNYLYDLDAVEKNHEHYMSGGEATLSRQLARDLKSLAAQVSVQNRRLR
ncbi:MAG TPA: hypothetical protein ENI62_13945 [Gammaproteobacteria bacterium]|nr:hypothetical protein [Gammaproteobacteria bacterium]